MSIIKSFSVGNGDMFYIRHGSDNFTVIDCYLNDENTNDEIIDEIKKESEDKGIKRFISTHPDEDHIKGIKILDEKWEIINFYCVENKATKDEPSEDFKKYCELRDSSKKAFYIEKGCSRNWMNQSSNERGSSGISILWPDTDNKEFKKELEKVKEGDSPNNISPIIKYSLEDGVRCLWMGDIEADFLDNVKEEIDFGKVDILFAPHHGRKSGKIPEDILKEINPKLIIIGEAPSKYLNYYNNYNTITQNTSKEIVLECEERNVHIYVGNSNYSVDFLKNKNKTSFENYIGTLEV
ncbi:MBL fold metallo-hydrolase [Clostridium perfringens]|uniref:MBL fold metallo-hydrolase n=1 Tax=Clostridium perfringens TaxID=1502 RepID=UPI001ABB858F|nr:MBL fold metallo-hydrolase [Clostridium perfringens]MBO3366398.1 hypothetical protein [Clostridium perfringens]MBO3383368.1 hypothetical protein [Clostridium perfringens]MDO6338551.1 MBL fold metallo-hydrolase [Clostridium perfringens]